MGSKTTYDCYCPCCDDYIGSWWHYDWANAPIFMGYPRTKSHPDGYPYCWNCRRKFGWFELRRRSR